MSIKKFLEKYKYNFDTLVVEPSGGSLELYEVDISPMEFLNLAEDDFQKGGLASEVNCITNCKRSIVCQMDQILLTFGFSSLRWNIPKKIEYLKKLGLLSPSILRKVSSARNLLEHEYVKPSKEDVEMAIDIASLFVMASRAIFSPFTNEIHLCDDLTRSRITGRCLRYLTLTIERNDQGEAFVEIRSVEEQDNFYNIKSGDMEEFFKKRGRSETYLINNHDPLFFCIVSLGNALGLGYRIDDAIQELNEAYRRSN